MRRFMVFLGVVAQDVVVVAVVLFLTACVCALACGQVYQVELPKGRGSAVCVGKTIKSQRSVFVTAGHLFRGTTQARLSDGRQIHRLKVASDVDLASFEVDGSAEKVDIVHDVVDGADAIVCGYSDRRSFCFRGSIQGDQIFTRDGTHTLPGDSGGAVLVETGGRRCLAGVHYGFKPHGRQQTYFVTGRDICQHLTRYYGSCPTCPVRQSPNCSTCPQYSRPVPLVKVSPSPLPKPPACNVSVDYGRLASEFYQRYGSRLKGKDGRDAESVDLDLVELADVITSQYADRIRGKTGPSPAGIETLQARVRSLEQRPQRVVIVDGKTKTILDDETYKPGEAIVLDIHRLLQSAD